MGTKSHFYVLFGGHLIARDLLAREGVFNRPERFPVSSQRLDLLAVKEL